MRKSWSSFTVGKGTESLVRSLIESLIVFAWQWVNLPAFWHCLFALQAVAVSQPVFFTVHVRPVGSNFCRKREPGVSCCQCVLTYCGASSLSCCDLLKDWKEPQKLFGNEPAWTNPELVCLFCFLEYGCVCYCLLVRRPCDQAVVC